MHLVVMVHDVHQPKRARNLIAEHVIRHRLAQDNHPGRRRGGQRCACISVWGTDGSRREGRGMQRSAVGVGNGSLDVGTMHMDVERIAKVLALYPRLCHTREERCANGPPLLASLRDLPMRRSCDTTTTTHPKRKRRGREDGVELTWCLLHRLKYT
jgi:hypothetical protein